MAAAQKNRRKIYAKLMIGMYCSVTAAKSATAGHVFKCVTTKVSGAFTLPKLRHSLGIRETFGAGGARQVTQLPLHVFDNVRN